MWLALVALAAPAAAQTFPANNGSPVVDQAGILTPAQIQDLTSYLAALVNPRNAEYFYVLFLTYKKLGKAAESRAALAQYEKLKQSDSQPAATAARH